ncbi:hypothetical protein MMC24_004528 [Lignoscripta atroalba]|nr:hypothetical protein [Lignoscripta atroalba]
MGESTSKKAAKVALNSTKGLPHGLITSPTYDHSEELDSKRMTAEEKHALYMRGFTNTLQLEGLRSPEYYRDKSQCISFQDCSPAEMGIIKAERLKWGYIEPKELAERLRQLKKSSGDYSLPKYRHQQMEWDKSPVPGTPHLEPPPDADWLDYQTYGILDMKKQLGEHLTESYIQQAQKHWDRVENVNLPPLPDSHLLKHITRSPSGTLFPRYLVKGLRELRDRVNERGMKNYYEEYEKAKERRKDIIGRWQDENPGTILADDWPSIYRTWPAELMAQLDAADQDAIREGHGRYKADLEKTEKNMQKLVTFWRGCGLVTGIRSPLSPQWPDPKAKLRGLSWPDYIMERRRVIQRKFGSTDEGQKRQRIDLARWKEAVLNTDSDPMASEMPLSQPLLNELETTWREWKKFLGWEDMEDRMITILTRWRNCQQDTQCRDRASTTPRPSPDAGVVGSRLSRSDSRALEEALQILRKTPPNERRLQGSREDSRVDSAVWFGRLRPKPGAQGTSRQRTRKPKSLTGRSQGIVKSSNSKPLNSQLSVSAARLLRACEPVSSIDSSLQCPLNQTTPQIKPIAVETRRMAKSRQYSSGRRWARHIHNHIQGVQKNRKIKPKHTKPQPERDKHGQQLLRLLTPPES